MKKIATGILFVLLFTSAQAQQTEIRLCLNAGLFSFTGKSAEAVSAINYSDKSNAGSTNNPYGTDAGLGGGLSANLKRVSKSRVLLGINLGFEVLRSRIRINGIDGFTGTATYHYEASGQTFLNYNFVNLSPYFGYRLKANRINLDLTGGLEIACCLAAREKGAATALNGTKYKTAVGRNTIRTDLRPGLQLAAGTAEFGVYAGYSVGLANYKSGYMGGTNDCYARLVRFGITWRFK